MKTEVIMKRELFGRDISQKSQSEFFSATDLVRAGNAWRAEQGLSLFNMTDWFNTKATKEFVSSLEKKFGTVNYRHPKGWHLSCRFFVNKMQWFKHDSDATRDAKIFANSLKKVLTVKDK